MPIPQALALTASAQDDQWPCHGETPGLRLGVGAAVGCGIRWGQWMISEKTWNVLEHWGRL
jgi:hypothetical protein